MLDLDTKYITGIYVDRISFSDFNDVSITKNYLQNL